MANGVLDRHRPMILLVGSLVVTTVFLGVTVFGPKAKAIERLKVEAETKTRQVADSIRLWGEMSRRKDEMTQAWSRALARFDERIPGLPGQERFMAEVSALAVRHQLREFHFTLSDRTKGESTEGTVRGPVPAVPVPEATTEATAAGGVAAEAGSAARQPSFTEIRYRIHFTSTYQDLADFLDDLPRMQRLVALHSVTIREKEGKMETAVEISIYHRGAL